MEEWENFHRRKPRVWQ